MKLAVSKSFVPVVLAVFLSPSLPLKAAIISLTADTTPGQFASGSAVNVPIRVDGFTLVTSAQFTLEWDPAVLTVLTPSSWAPGSFGEPALGLTSGNFDISAAGPGKLLFSWFEPTTDGATLSAGSAFFTVNFTAAGTAGTESDINFVTSAMGSELPPEIVFFGGESADLSFVSGNVQVVPEPINSALGVFACVIIGMTVVRRLISERTSQS